MQESAGTAAAGGKQVRLMSVDQQNSRNVYAAWRGYGLVGSCRESFISQICCSFDSLVSVSIRQMFLCHQADS